MVFGLDSVFRMICWVPIDAPLGRFVAVLLTVLLAVSLAVYLAVLLSLFSSLFFFLLLLFCTR